MADKLYFALSGDLVKKWVALSKEDIGAFIQKTVEDKVKALEGVEVLKVETEKVKKN